MCNDAWEVTTLFYYDRDREVDKKVLETTTIQYPPIFPGYFLESKRRNKDEAKLYCAPLWTCDDE
jgi:hypothetical protein